MVIEKMKCCVNAGNDNVHIQANTVYVKSTK